MQNFSRRLLHADQGVSLSRCLGVCVAILPLMVAFLLRVPRVALDNFTDAVFYLSYARQFEELVLRYGFPYYATRFGGILPDALSAHLFGEIDGIWILRWGLSSAVSLALFLFFRKRHGLLAGIIASLLWSLNPAALRLLCTTYVDSTAVPFLFLGCLLFASGRGNVAVCLIAGILFGLAASAHLYATFALIFLTPWLIGSQWNETRRLIRSAIWTVVGFLGTFLIGWLWYWVVWGMPAIFSPTIELMRDLGNGQAALWKKPLGEALRETPAWFAPLALLPALLIASIKGSPFVRGASLSLLASVGFFWGGDLFGNAYVLSMPFYFSFLLPVMVLSSATICCEMIRIKAGCKALIFLTVAGILASFALVSLTGIFAKMLGKYRADDIPVIELATALRRELPKASQDGEVMRFWYDDDLAKPGGSDRRMIGAFWLHFFGKLTGEKKGYVSFPQMSPADAEAIRFSEVDRIVIFDQDLSRVELAEQDLKNQKLPFTVFKKLTLAAPGNPEKKLAVAIFEKEVPAATGRKSVDLSRWEAFHGGKVISQMPEGMQLLSGHIKGWDFAKLPVGTMKKFQRLVIHCKVEGGMIRFELHEEGKDHPFQHVEKWRINGTQEVSLTADTYMKNAVLTLRSMYPTGTHSRVFFEKVEIADPAAKP